VNGRGAAAAGAAILALLAGCTTSTPVVAHRTTPTAGVAVGPNSSAGPNSPPGPGADGLGDPYYPKAGNGGYDVANYDLDLKYDPATGKLTGSERITATATANLNRFNLDLKALTVESVTIDGVAATAKPEGDELVVTPARNLATGTRFVTAIRYGGIPQSYKDSLGEIGFLKTDDGAVAIGEPEVAASWFPVNDHPRDKATYAVKITAPDGLTAMSNGVLKGKQSAAGWTTWSWQEDSPMVSYLATVVIGNYRVQQSTHAGKPVFLAVNSALDSQADAQLARTPEVVDFLESKFGPYPFNAMGGIVINDKRVRFALENQTRPVYTGSFFGSGKDATWALVHELAHQWYGDSVSINEWKDIWLNEGFATYAEWLWTEKSGGQSVQKSFDTQYANFESPMWGIPPGNPGKPNLFSISVYTRGAMALHVLRMNVGDDAFFKILRTWASEKANGNATTREFIALAERISGKPLGQVFDEWLYGTVRPAHP
jgi:aminopeptidase N